ncbi:hypothetical protein F5888DRAFT_1233616 [Russula emetica]|nr:hypothetical protein F5888DRAFT_1233616 [Russula emetica]
MLTQPQHALSSPIPFNDLGIQEPLQSKLNLPTVPEDPMPDTVTSPGPMLLGAFGEMSDNEWTGRLYSNWNGTYVHARASAAVAIGDPYAHAFLRCRSVGDSHPHRMLSTWPKYLQLDLVVDSEISTLDIQAWIRQTKAPLVRLGYHDTNGTDKYYFDNLVETLRNARGYAIVKWENRGRTLERLLIAPLGKVLLCAAFPEDGISSRPMHQLPRPTRVIKLRHERSRKKEKSRRGLSG